MNRQGNAYTFIYAAVMVAVVAALLSFVAIELQPRQANNVRVEKMQNILSALKIESTAANAQELYDKYIIDSYAIGADGNKKEGIDAFDINLKVELKKEATARNLPIYLSDNNGDKNYVIPVRGKGLWGPIWGYIALKPDLNTIYGAVFDHKSETPGLGAEINTPFFQQQFVGKQLFNGSGEFTSLIVKKGNASNSNEIDGITGGTITSKGLEDMLYDCLVSYESYFKAIN